MIRTRDRISRIDEIKRQLAGEIAKERNIKKWTQMRMAAMTDMSQGEISEIERGCLRRFTIDRLCMILIVLGHRVHVSVC